MLEEKKNAQKIAKIEDYMQQLHDRLSELEYFVRIDSKQSVIYLLESHNRWALVSATSVEEAQAIAVNRLHDHLWAEADVAILGAASIRYKDPQIIKYSY